MLIDISKDFKSGFCLAPLCIFFSFAGPEFLAEGVPGQPGVLGKSMSFHASQLVICLPVCLTKKKQGWGLSYLYATTQRAEDSSWSMLWDEYRIAHPGMYERRKAILQFLLYLKFPKNRQVNTIFFNLGSNIILGSKQLKKHSLFFFRSLAEII